MVFPQFVQAGIQGPARHRDSSLDSNTPHGAAPALDKTLLTKEVQHMQTPDLKAIHSEMNTMIKKIYF